MYWLEKIRFQNVQRNNCFVYVMYTLKFYKSNTIYIDRQLIDNVTESDFNSWEIILNYFKFKWL